MLQSLHEKNADHRIDVELAYTKHPRFWARVLLYNL